MGVELTLTVQNDKHIRLQTRGGGQGDTQPANLDKLTLSTIDVFQKWLVAGKISERREMEVLGMHLYSVLFQGKIEEYFRLQLGKVPKRSEEHTSELQSPY